ncbi:MAG: Phage portal protein [Firmicutes bacterium ADurb.Bin506]|nr:MAG: Phage portal protein [Firmicutes bacterium ADurb.Bin506]
MAVFNRRRQPPPSDQFARLENNRMVPRWTRPPERNTQDWIKMYSKSPRLAVVARIASDLSFATGKLLTVDSKGDEREVMRHSFLDFWESPNPLHEFTRASLWQLEEIYLLLKGEGYFVIERDPAGRPAELWPVPTHWVLMTPYLGHPYYTVKTTSGTILEVSVDDMYVQKELNPLDPFLRGLGQAEAIADEVEIDEYAAQFQKRFFYNDATPNLIVSMPGSSDEQRKRFRAEWLERFKGVFKSHGIATTDGDINIQKVAESMKDMDMVNGRTFIRNATLEHFGVPREIMGITESSNRATSEAAQFIYAQNVIMPRLRRREEAINQQLLPLFGDGLIWRYDDIVPRNQEFDKLKAIDGWNAGLLTKDEARELIDMPAATTGGDVYKTTFSDIFIRSNEDPASISSSMATLQYGDETAAEEIEVEAPADDIIEVGALGGKQRKSVSLTSVARSEDAAARESTTAFEIATTKYFREQARRISNSLGATQKAHNSLWDSLAILITWRGMDGQVDSEAWGALTEAQRKSLVDEFVGGLADWPNEAKVLNQIFDPLWKKAYNAGATSAQSLFNLRGVQRPELISTAKLRGGQRVVRIQQATKDAIASIVSGGIENGDSTQLIADSIMQEMGATEQRARLIAQQETMTSLSTGQYDMYKKAGALTKTWHHMSTTEHYRRDHKRMNGETVPIDGKFSNGLRFPRDPDGPAEEVIQCRCVMTPNF